MTAWFASRSALISLALAGLMSFGGSVVAEETEDAHVVDPDRGFSQVERDYPDMDERYSREGVPPGLEAVRSVSLGMSRDELLSAIGEPKLVGDDGNWEYHLALPLTERDSLICQYLVHLDADDRLSQAAWRRPQCGDLVKGTGD